MKKYLSVRQNSYKDCGVACLISIMRYFGVDPPYEEVAYYLRLNKDGTNAYNIINGSANYGFDGYGIHYTYEEIMSNKVSLPIICHTIKNNMYHFIVVYEVNKNNLLIMDPASNTHKISLNDFKNIYLGTSIVIYPIKKIDKLNKRESLLKFISKYIIHIKKNIIFTIIISLLVVILNLIINYYLTLLIDNNIKHNILIIITIIFGFIAILKILFTFIRDKLLLRIENDVISRINIDINRKLFNLPYLFFKNKSTGEIESRLNDLSIFRDIISNSLISICLNIIFVLCSFIILFLINKRLFIICFIEIIIYFIITNIFKNKVSNNIENISIYESDYKKCINESICGYETNKNINSINLVLKKLEIKYLSYLDKIYKFRNTKNYDYFIKNIFLDILYILLIFFEISYLNRGILTIGNLILFNTIMAYFTEPLKDIVDFNYNIILLRNVYKRINDLFVVKTSNIISKNIFIEGDIKIQNLSYSIDGLHNIFENINIEIKYKSKYLIYGHSGSGKSTLIKILLKYLKDYKGEILINNINLKDIADNTISNSFTYVSQNSFINNDTLINNIIYDREVDITNYEEVIDICNLKELRDSKMLRNNFLIEEDGFNISGGERQKIILARSLLKPFNYLILDEALSEVDELEEIDIMNKIFKKYAEKTIIYISHRKRIIDSFKLKYKLERSKSE